MTSSLQLLVEQHIQCYITTTINIRLIRCQRQMNSSRADEIDASPNVASLIEMGIGRGNLKIKTIIFAVIGIGLSGWANLRK